MHEAVSGVRTVASSAVAGVLRGIGSPLVENLSETACTLVFASGVVEAAALTFNEASELADEGLGLKVILVMNLSHGGKVVLARTELPSLSDLRGKHRENHRQDLCVPQCSCDRAHRHGNRNFPRDQDILTLRHD